MRVDDVAAGARSLPHLWAPRGGGPPSDENHAPQRNKTAGRATAGVRARRGLRLRRRDHASSADVRRRADDVTLTSEGSAAVKFSALPGEYLGKR